MRSIAIEVKSVSKRYGKFEAVKNVSFQVYDGEVFSLLGPNGAGKTTLMLMIAGILKPSNGEIYVNNLNVMKDSIKVKRLIGYCPQESIVYELLTGRENLMYYAGLYGLPKSEAKRKVDELLKLVELEDWGDKLVKKYSGGMKKRLSLAATLIHDPEVILLDEPTTGLDPGIRRSIWDLIDKLRSEGKTVLLATHYMEEADILSDRVAIMNEGKIVALDSPDNLKKILGPYSVVEFEVKYAPNNIINILSKYSETNQVLVRDDVYKIYTRDPDSILPKVISEIISNGGKVVYVHVTEPTLEDVFLKLTGRRLKE